MLCSVRDTIFHAVVSRNVTRKSRKSALLQSGELGRSQTKKTERTQSDPCFQQTAKRKQDPTSRRRGAVQDPESDKSRRNATPSSFFNAPPAGWRTAARVRAKRVRPAPPSSISLMGRAILPTARSVPALAAWNAWPPISEPRGKPLQACHQVSNLSDGFESHAEICLR